MSLDRGDSPQAGSRPPHTRATSHNSAHSESRSSSSFWLDLNGIERWFDSLDTAERVQIVTALITRSTESQIHQYESVLRSTLHSLNLKPFGSGSVPNSVLQSSSHPLSSFYGTMNQPGPTPASSSTPSLSSVSASVQSPVSTNSSKVPRPRDGDNHSSSNEDLFAQQGTNPIFRPGKQQTHQTHQQQQQQTHQSANPIHTPHQKSNSVGQSHQPGHSTPNNTHSAHKSGFPAGINSLKTQISPFTHSSTDLYSQAFLPISGTYTPWMDTRRPHSASEVWSDSLLASPSLKPVHHGEISSIGEKQGLNSPTKSVHAWFQQTTQIGTTQLSQSSPHTQLTQNQAGQLGQLSQQPPQQPQQPPQSQPLSAPTSQYRRQDTSKVDSRDNSPVKGAKRGVNCVDVELLSDIGAWLRSSRLHKYTGNLSGMKWQEVVLLDNDGLEARGVNALGARRKLLKMFEEVRVAQEAGILPADF